MKVLVASASKRRRNWYKMLLLNEGFIVETTGTGIDCANRLCTDRPDVLLLETTLPWGGADGVLAIRAEDHLLQGISVVLIASDETTSVTPELSRFEVQDFYETVPRDAELVMKLRERACQHESMAIARFPWRRWSTQELP